LSFDDSAGIGYLVASVLVHPAFIVDPHRAAEDVARVRGKQATAANGAAMRTSVAGVPFFWEAMTVRRNTRDMCAATHADGRCQLSCLLVTAAVARMLQGQPLCGTMVDRIIEEDLEISCDAGHSRRHRTTMTLPRSRYGLGFGIRLQQPGGQLVVDTVVPGGPADRMGLQPGDVISEYGMMGAV